MLVAGEAGMGKSRLVAELGTRALATGALVLVGECVELAEGELAFLPIIAALRGVMAEEAALEGLGGPLRSALAALWPVAGAVDGVVGGREQLLEGVYRVLAGLAERQPVLLIVEDVHWIDRSSRDLLAFLVRNARRDAIALVVTYRPDELHRGHPMRPFLVELERSGRGQRVELEALARSEVAEQLQAIAGHVPDGGVIDRIFRRSEGNPFYAEELLASAQDGGGQLPASLRDTLLARAERLSALTRGVLQAAAIAGRSADYRLLAHLVGLDEPKLLDALREATDKHLLVPTAGGMTYAFRHELLREAIYDDALAAERLRLHRAIAVTLGAHREYAGPSAAAELAHHWHAAGERRAALTASVLAAAEAERMHAYGEALRHVDRALELWDQVEGPERASGSDRVDLLLRGSELAGWAGEADRAVALAEQARGEVDEAAEPLRAAAAEARIGSAMHYAGRGADAIEHVAAGRRLVPREPPSLAYAEALVGEGRVLMVNGRSPEARAPLEEAIPLVELLGDRTLQARLLGTLAVVYAELGEFERAIAAGREGLQIAQETGSAEDIVRAYVNGSQAIDDAGRIEEALGLGIEGIAAAEQLGMGHAAGDQLRMQAGWRLVRMGRLQDAERMIQPALDAATSPFNVAGLEALAGYLASERGEFDVAEQLLEHAWELMPQSGGSQLIGLGGAWRVLLHLQRGEPERARECLADGLSRVQDSDGELIYNAPLFWLAARLAADVAEQAKMPGRADAAAQSTEVAAAAIDEFDRAISRAPGDGAPPEALAFRALAAAELARLRGEHDPEPWRAAADQFAELSEPLRAAYADFRAAEAVALSGGRPLEIAEPLRAAFEVASNLGARPLREEMEALARRAGIALESADGPGLRSRVRTHRPRARSAPADCRGPDQSPDRRAAVHYHQDRERPRLSHPDEARRHEPRRGGRRSPPPGANQRSSRRVTLTPART